MHRIEPILSVARERHNFPMMEMMKISSQLCLAKRGCADL